MNKLTEQLNRYRNELRNKPTKGLLLFDRSRKLAISISMINFPRHGEDDPEIDGYLDVSLSAFDEVSSFWRTDHDGGLLPVTVSGKNGEKYNICDYVERALDLVDIVPDEVVILQTFEVK